MKKLSYTSTLLGHVWRFAMEHKALWIVPIVLGLLGIAALLTATYSAAPFVYTLF